MTEVQLKIKPENCDGEPEYLPKIQCLKDTPKKYNETATCQIKAKSDLDSQNNNEPSEPENIKTEEALNPAEQPSEKQLDNVDLTEPENIDDSLKIEIDNTENILDHDTALEIKAEKTGIITRLKVNLENLSLKNEEHKNAMANLPKFSIKLPKLDNRVLRKVNNFGSLKYSSHLLKPLRPECQKREYPKGHYFSRKQNVVFHGKKFDKKFFHLALRRKANVDDGGKFLKYQCPTCPYKSWSFMALSKHHIGLHGFRMKWTFTCPDCPYTVDRECDFKRHMQRHKKEPDLQCPHCPYISRFDVGLRTHLRRWHLPAKEAKTLLCSECNFVSICKTTYEAHLKVHMNRGAKYLSRFLHTAKDGKDGTEGEVLKCEYCNFKTTNKNGLRRHMQETHKIENPFERSLYNCTICGFETKHKFSYRDHLLTHKGNDEVPSVECYLCGFKTKYKKYLTVHMRTDHPRVKKDESTLPWYNCAECTKKYRIKFQLKQHIFRQHRDSELLMCHHCNYTTKIMATLRRHTLTNHIQVKEKIYECQKCSKKSRDKAKHKAHLRTHKFICYMCGTEYSTKDNLRYHIVGHMSKKEQKLVVVIHKCSCCDYETRNNHHYRRHMKRLNHYPDKDTEILKSSKNNSGRSKVKNHLSKKEAKIVKESRNDSGNNKVENHYPENEPKVVEASKNDSVDNEVENHYPEKEIQNVEESKNNSGNKKVENHSPVNEPKVVEASKNDSVDNEVENHYPEKEIQIVEESKINSGNNKVENYLPENEPKGVEASENDSVNNEVENHYPEKEIQIVEESKNDSGNNKVNNHYPENEPKVVEASENDSVNNEVNNHYPHKEIETLEEGKNDTANDEIKVKINYENKVEEK